METLVGFAIGFLVGTREGKQGLARLRESCVAIRESADVKHLLGEAVLLIGPMLREVARASEDASGARSAKSERVINYGRG